MAKQDFTRVEWKLGCSTITGKNSAFLGRKTTFFAFADIPYISWGI